MSLFALIFNPEGKINRLQFLGGMLFLWLIVALLYAVPIFIELYLLTSSAAFYELASGGGQFSISSTIFDLTPAQVSWSAFVIFVPGTLAFFYGKICLDIKRFHDTGYSSWLILLFLVPYVNILVFLFLLFYPGRER